MLMWVLQAAAVLPRTLQAGAVVLAFGSLWCMQLLSLLPLPSPAIQHGFCFNGLTPF
jgi:hypothetical protein